MAGAAQLGDGLTLMVGPARRVFEQRPAVCLTSWDGGVLADPGQWAGGVTPAVRRVLFQAARRTSSTAALASLMMWNGSAHTLACGAWARVTLA